MSIACLCGVPNGTPHSHFCPLAGRVEPRLEYAAEGTSRKLYKAEAKIKKIEELIGMCLDDGKTKVKIYKLIQILEDD